MNSVFDSFEDCKKVILEYQRETSTNFVSKYNDKAFNCELEDWQKISKYLRFHTENIPFLGYPFKVVGSQCLTCHQGVSHVKKDVQKDNEGDHSCSKKRRRTSCSKKVGCTAKIIITQIFAFPNFTLDEDTRHKRQLQSHRLREAISKEPNKIHVVPKFYMSLPDLEAHTGHPTGGPIAGRQERIDPAVTQFLIREAKAGVRKLADAKRHLEAFVEQDFPDVKDKRSSRRFFPSDKDISNRLYNVRRTSLYSKDDQKNLSGLVRKWREEPDVHIRYRPSTGDEDGEQQDPLLFVYQDDQQRHLLLRYGRTMCLLDATYKACQSKLPLFFLCVRTNFQYVVVATFVTQYEKRKSIEEALAVIKDWNPGWKPEHFMTDKYLAEMHALETVYPGSTVLLCDFYREKAWTEFLNKNKGEKKDNNEAIERLLTGVAKAKTKPLFEEAVKNLKSSPEWKNSASLQRWYKTYWEPCIERWAAVYRSTQLKVAITINNGIELQNETLKHPRFIEYKRCSLSDLLTVVIDQFLINEFDIYKNANIDSFQECGKLESELPFISHNMPKDIVHHIANNWGSIQNAEEIVNEGNGKFMVGSERLRYIIDLWVPYCECFNWAKDKLPCKHMCAVFKFYPETWMEVPEYYRNSPFLTIDWYCITGQRSDMLIEMPHCEMSVSNCEFSGSDEEEQKQFAPLPLKHRMRHRCNEVLKDLQDVVLDISDLDYLKSLEEQLLKTLQQAKAMRPMEAGLNV
ncbi:uncharacterized protein LOC126819484 [Patella vulgata]|uniref:uncharacterized protein LOC126819484 n=1 Tax=Patella vulgata TaxID=6465 RepID=UPI0021800C86|nr:uncharacterized protein LOC126819484 [Patella vulgata]